MIKKYFSWIELSIVQAIIYTTIWLTNEYLATLITFIFVPLFFAILLISLIADQLEKSKISKSYYYFMASGFIVPLLIALFMKLFLGASDWQ